MILRSLKLSPSQSCFIFGARGTGKSTYLREQLKKRNVSLYFINLLEDSFYRRYGAQPDLLIEDVKKIPAHTTIVIDEIQKLPKLLDIIHHVIESQKRRFIMTGSSARKLKRGAANLLAGRAFQYFMHPITHDELGDAFDLQAILETGSLPKVVSLEGSDKIEYLQTYVQTYLKEEVLEEQLTRSTFAFRNFLEIAGQENGNSLNFSKIAKDLDIDYKTVQTFFQILEDTLVGFHLPAYHRSTRKSVKRQPKFYLFDLGVQRALTHSLHQPLRAGTSTYGKAFEHFLICEIFRLNTYRKHDYVLSHYQTSAGGEVDLVLNRGSDVIAIEIKSSTVIDPKKAAHLGRIAKPLKPTRICLLSQDKHALNIDGVECLYWRDFLKSF